MSNNSWLEIEERGKSEVAFARPLPSLAPSDSISKVKTRPTPNRNSDRRGSRKARTSRQSNGSEASRSSAQNGTAWSGSGAALTENNLEKLNEVNSRDGDGGSSNREPRSDEQEAPRRANRGSNRHQRYETNAKEAQRGIEPNNVNSDNDRVSGKASRSRNQAVALPKNAIDGNRIPSGGYRNNFESRNQSRKDSMLDNTPQTPNENTSGSGSSRKDALSKSTSARIPKSSRGPNFPTDPDVPKGWEKQIRTTTRRLPDGTKIREREVTMQPVGAG